MQQGIVGWLLAISDTWPYTIIRVLLLVVGVMVFLPAWFVAVANSFRGDRRRYFLASTIGFAAAMIGWGIPMFIAMNSHLSDCEMNLLVLGKLAHRYPQCAQHALAQQPQKSR
jgi:hypothetical protein